MYNDTRVDCLPADRNTVIGSTFINPLSRRVHRKRIERRTGDCSIRVLVCLWVVVYLLSLFFFFFLSFARMITLRDMGGKGVFLNLESVICSVWNRWSIDFLFLLLLSEWLYLNFKSWKWRVGKNFSSILLLLFFFLSTRQIKNFWILKNYCCCKECEKFVVDSFFLLLVRATIYTRDGDFFLNFRNLVLYCGEVCCEWRVKNLSLIFFLLLLWLLWEIWEIFLNFTMLFELWNIIHRFFFLLLYDFFIFIKRLVFIVEFVTNMKNESRKLSIEERKNCRKL